MPLPCNINAKGKAIRLSCGIILLVIGVVLLVAWAWRGGGWIVWIISIAMMLSGAFAIFEARAGWCALRALGMKTPF